MPDSVFDYPSPRGVFFLTDRLVINLKYKLLLILTCETDCENKLRHAIFKSADQTINYKDIREELNKEVDKALRNVRRRYHGYITSLHGSIATIVNKDLPDSFY